MMTFADINRKRRRARPGRKLLIEIGMHLMLVKIDFTLVLSLHVFGGRDCLSRLPDLFLSGLPDVLVYPPQGHDERQAHSETASTRG
jgi:hypothetical protein